MIQISSLRNDAENIIKALAIKNFDASLIVPEILICDDERRSTQKMVDDYLSELNK